MQSIASCLMNIGPPWALATTLIATVASLVICIVGAVAKARECRQLRLENDKLELEINLLKVEVARKGIAVSIPSAQELDCALRDRAAFAHLKTLGKVSKLTRASPPEDPLFEQSFLDAKEKLRKFVIRIAVVGAGAAACSLIAVALWR